MTDFRVEIDNFRGPLDLLLYLVRKHEVEITEIPVSVVVEQFAEYLDVLQALDVDSVGEFLEMASTLAEIKSRMILPRADEVLEVLDDPRQELVLRLLEYKKFKDAAATLDERSRLWQDRFVRRASDLSLSVRDLAEEPVREIELWDLVSAFGRVMRDNESSRPACIVYDETPVEVFMERIHAQLRERGRLAFSELFQPQMHKSTLIGIFLALLELVRHHGVIAEQNDLFGEIWLLPSSEVDAPLNLADVTDYDHAGRAAQADAALQPHPR